MTYIWSARNVEQGLKEVTEIRVDLLQTLKQILDEYNGDERSIEYYDLIAGIWLEVFSHNVYCAWLELNERPIDIESSSIPIIHSLEHAEVLAKNIKWHQHIKWAVSCLLNGKNCELWGVGEGLDLAIENKVAPSRLSRLSNNFTTKKPEVIITAPNFKCGAWESVYALWRWRKWIALDNLDYPFSYRSNVNFRWRKNKSIELTTFSNDFSSIVKALMPLYIPNSLLEGFNLFRNAVLSFPIFKPRVLFTANAVHDHLAFKVLAAEWRQDGTLLLCHQHGGGYGLESAMIVENYEIRVSDHFYTWGWKKSGIDLRVLSPALPHFDIGLPAIDLLLVCQDLPRVPYRLMHVPMPGSIFNMHQNATIFVKNLKDSINLTVRPYPQDFGWGAKDLMRNVSRNMKFDSKSNFYSLLKKTKVVVFSYLGTGWLETLGLNIPTICFYDPSVYIFRPEVIKDIERLCEVGVLHKSPIDAVNFINSLDSSIQNWWAGSDVMAARLNFVEKYARISSDWIGDWEREFRSILASDS